MKKLLGIVVLGLLLSGNAYAKEIILNCENYRVIGYYKNGGTSDEPGDSRLNATFKINSKKKTIYKLNNRSNKFYKKDKVKWSEGSISWKEDLGDMKFYRSINRYDLTYTNKIIYDNDPDWKRVDDFAKCKIGKKKF